MRETTSREIKRWIGDVTSRSDPLAEILFELAYAGEADELFDDFGKHMEIQETYVPLARKIIERLLSTKPWVSA